MMKDGTMETREITTKDAIETLRLVTDGEDINWNRMFNRALKHGSEHVVDWMESHGFWDAADAWRRYGFLIDEDV
jgi:hypothetical protein